MGIKINDRINLKNNLCGFVRYIGKVEGRSGEWVGIELDSPAGSNDGIVDNTRYFSCKEKHGLFVKFSRLQDSLVEMSNGTTKFTELSNSRSIYESEPFGLPYERKEPKKYQNIDQTHFDKSARADTLQNRNFTKLSTSDLNNSSISIPNNFSNSFLTSPSLFDIDMYGDNADIKKEIERLRNENLGYRKVIENLVKKCSGTLNSICANLKELEKKISKISNIKFRSTTDQERNQVVNLVSSIYEAEKVNDRLAIATNYEKFKEIMSKYNIKVE